MAKHMTAHDRRKVRIRKKISGDAARPRLAVYKSLKHTYAQIVDDSSGTTLAFVSTNSKALRDEIKEDAKTDAAKRVGTAIARAAIAKGVEKVVFDRSGFDYHGRIAAVAQAARDAGLKF